jgi:hypothetical protein
MTLYYWFGGSQQEDWIISKINDWKVDLQNENVSQASDKCIISLTTCVMHEIIIA